MHASDAQDFPTYRKVLFALVLVSTLVLRLNLRGDEVVVEENTNSDGSLGSMKRSIEQTTVVATQADSLNVIAQALMRILIKFQSTLEQRVRLESISGVSEAKTYVTGTQAYHQEPPSIMNMHDHADMQRVVGLGELGAVLNGVPFHTRHLDYNLASPVTGGGDANYNKVVDIDTPEVPPSVLAQPTVAGQVAEMQEYFKAWATNNATHRKFAQYFPPVLCVLEGAWVLDKDALQEPFPSDRNSFDAQTWTQLFDKARFLLNSGLMNGNVAFLPGAARDMVDQIKFSARLGSGSSFSVTAMKRPSRSPTSFWNDIATYNVAKGVSSMIGLTSSGYYLFVAHDRRSASTGGKAQLQITCTSGASSGCGSAVPAFCYPTSAGKCPVFVGGTGLINVTYKTSEVAGTAYGPLKGCFSIRLGWSGLVGLTGSISIWRDYYVNNKSQLLDTFMTATTVPSTMEYNGCISDPFPVIANFESRVVCQKLRNNTLPFNRFRIIDDIGMQMSLNPPKPLSSIAKTRRALFQLNSRDSDKFYDNAYGYGLIDDFMEQIPGKDNHGANLNEKLFGAESQHYIRNEVLNAAYYSRFYKMIDGDAMGRQARKRGFNDDTMWAARTTQPRVSGLKVFSTMDGLVEEKWTWAVPLEILYLTPLAKWNPYNLPVQASADTVKMGGRNGGFTAATAYNGISRDVFYQTPEEFFSDVPFVDSADTAQKVVGVMDTQGNVQRVRPSGVHIFLPPIPGIPDRIRQRWPILPVMQKKDVGMAQVFALKHSVGNTKGILSNTFINIGYAPKVLETCPGRNNHTHKVIISPTQVQFLIEEEGTVTVNAQSTSGHSHVLTIAATKFGDGYEYSIIDCDGTGPVCEDGVSCLTDSMAPFVPPKLPPASASTMSIAFALAVSTVSLLAQCLF